MKREEIHDISNWCDRWCEKCNQTGLCKLYRSSVNTPITPEDFLKSLSEIFATTMKVLEEYAEKKDMDLGSLKKSDFKNEYVWQKLLFRNDDGIALSKQYRKQVTNWLDSLKDDYGMEVRMQDPMLSDCIEVILWYQHFFEVKLTRALMSQKEEKEDRLQPYDSLGNAKLLLVSIERNIGAWGYVYQKFKDDEDEILDILICLQNFAKKIEQVFPGARAFVRPGLD